MLILLKGAISSGLYATIVNPKSKGAMLYQLFCKGIDKLYSNKEQTFTFKMKK